MSKRIGLLAMLGVAGLVAMAACDNNPLSKDRDKVTRLDLNPSFANVKVNDSTFVTAIALNRNGEPTGDAVQGTACDGKITIKNDPTRTNFEPPERWIVHGVTAGQSCVNVSSAGVTSSVVINVVQ